LTPREAGAGADQWGKIMAVCLLASLPPIIIYAFPMDYDVAGLTAGVTKR
jgi:multiple sugar transport system permease protein